MKDKQIIIDYKTLCENYSKEVGCYNTFDGRCNKEQCFTYKLLQLLQDKEQECEALKEEIKTNGFGLFNIEMAEQLNQLKKSNKGLQKENEGLNMKLTKVYEDIKLSPLCYKCDEEECLRKEIDKLKAEKKELKKVSCKFQSYCTCNTEKFLQTLTEIKSILEFYANSQMGEEQPDKTYHMRLNGGYIMVYDPKPARQALQKISECEVKND